MNRSELLDAVRLLPEGAQVTLTVTKGDLVRALEDGGANPGRLVSTVWCEEQLGRSRTWWAEECRSGRIQEAVQESPGSPWLLPQGAARAHLEARVLSKPRTRSRRRGPWKRGTS